MAIMRKQLSSFGVIAVLMGLWQAFGPVELIPISKAEPLKPSKTIKTEYQYAAKVACSLLLPHQDGTLAHGTYRTVINIHNPTDKKVTIAAKVALATQFGSDPGPFGVTPFKEAVLQPDGAVGVSCFDVAGYFCPIDGVCVDFAFLEGFLVVKSPVPLDVVGVYTARHTDGEVESIDVETVQPREIRETVNIGAAEPTKPGGGKRVATRLRAALRTEGKNPNKCVAESLDSLAPGVKNAWMILRTIATRPVVELTAAVFASVHLQKGNRSVIRQDLCRSVA
jgi:hypothetical protein